MTDEGTMHIATVADASTGRTPIDDANALLIAASPDLLRVATRALATFAGWHGSDCPAANQSNAPCACVLAELAVVIAQAEGREP